MYLKTERMKVNHMLFFAPAFDFTARLAERDCCTSPQLLYGFL